MGSKIAIIGAHPQTRMLAPYFDPEWSIWACSRRNTWDTPDGLVKPFFPRWDAWFELHKPMGLDIFSGEIPQGYVEWLRRQPRVYVRDEQEQFPGAVEYPEKEMKDRFGPFFFTSSVSYMTALALSAEPAEIGLWGVELSHDKEYAYQRPGCHYFIQKAWDMGIKVTVPPESSILEPPKDQW